MPVTTAKSGSPQHWCERDFVLGGRKVSRASAAFFAVLRLRLASAGAFVPRCPPARPFASRVCRVHTASRHISPRPGRPNHRGNGASLRCASRHRGRQDSGLPSCSAGTNQRLLRCEVGRSAEVEGVGINGRGRSAAAYFACWREPRQRTEAIGKVRRRS